jgi:hypothetical protein
MSGTDKDEGILGTIGGLVDMVGTKGELEEGGELGGDVVSAEIVGCEGNDICA